MYILMVKSLLTQSRFMNVILSIPILVLVISLTCYPIQSDDLFMYLAIARNFLVHSSFPKLDPFLYTLNNYDWTILHQWLGYLIFYALYDLGGFNLIIIAKTLLVTISLFLPVLLTRRRTEKMIWVGSVFLAIYATSFRLMERTSLFSDFFIIVLLLILLREMEKPSWLKWSVPFLFLAWVNIHPVYPLGWGLCFLYLAAHFQKRKSASYQQFAVITVLSVLITLINPRGLDGVLYPFQFASHEGKVFRQYYFEWMPTLSPIYRYQAHTYFLMGLTVLNLSLLWICRKSKLYFETAASLFFVVYGFYAVRFVPTLCFTLVLLNVSMSRKLPDMKWARPISWISGLVLICLGIKNMALGYETISGPRQFGLGFDANVVPEKAAELILKTPQIGNVFNSHMFGSYLAWAWLEQRKIFYHGFVTDTNLFLKEYASFSADPKTFQQQVLKYNIGAFLLDRFQGNERLLQILVNDPDWALAYKDASSLIFLPIKRND